MSPDPVRPIASPVLSSSLDAALAAVKPGTRGRAGALITADGLRFDVGYKPTTRIDISASALRTWDQKTWTAGARVGFSW